MSEQPEALWLADVINNDPTSKTHHDEAASELRRLHAEVEALRADAERYRLWRSDHTDAASDSDSVSPMLMALADAWTPEQVDAAIDAARERT